MINSRDYWRNSQQRSFLGIRSCCEKKDIPAAPSNAKGQLKTTKICDTRPTKSTGHAPGKAPRSEKRKAGNLLLYCQPIVFLPSAMITSSLGETSTLLDLSQILVFLSSPFAL